MRLILRTQDGALLDFPASLKVITTYVILEQERWFERHLDFLLAWLRLFTGPIEKVFVTNQSDAPAELTITTRTDVPLVEVRQIPIAAASILAVFAVYLLLHWLLPGVSTIALATSKEAIAQPIYLLAIIAGAFLLTLFIIIPYNTFGEDVKMYKDSSLMTIMVLAILVAVWTASVSVADEIEGRTALTLLSKPISRREFVARQVPGHHLGEPF